MPDEVVTGDHSIADLRSMLQGTKETESPAASTQEATPPESGTEKAEQGSESARRGEDGKFAAKAEDKADDSPVPAGVQKRIDKAVKAQREAERQRDELQARLSGTQESRPAKETAPPTAAAASDKPKQEDFETYEDFLEKLTEWSLDQREARKDAERQAKQAEEARQPVIDAHLKRYAEAAEADDWDEIQAFADNLPASAEAQQAVIESEVGPQIVRHLFENPETAERFKSLSPARQAAEIGKIEALLTAAPAKPATKSPQLPRPPQNVGGSASAKARTLDDPDLTMGEFKGLFKQALRGR